MIEVKTINSIPIIVVVQLLCNTITMLSVQTFLLVVHVICLNKCPHCGDIVFLSQPNS